MILQELVLGRGELHLNLFAAGTKTGKGERYLGNTPGFTLSVQEDSVQRKGLSPIGLRTIRERHVIERTYQGDLTCDQMGAENLAAWFGTETTSQTVASIGSGDPALSETIVVNRGYGYQLGLNSHHLGHRNVTTVTFKIGATPIAIPGNINLLADNGRFTVLSDAPDIPDGTSLTVEYRTSGYTRRMSGAVRSMIEGSLRYIAFNPVGRQTDMFFPYVSIEPKGALDLKTSDWQNLQFTITLMELFGQDLYYVGSIR